VGRTGRLAAHGHAYSFFTRNLARIAPPLAALLQAHGQALDPNLLALAQAWQLAEEHLAAAGRELPGAAAAAGGAGGAG
jgi:ATP-dependent RNA helicase DDX5/DBP2